MPVQNAEIAAMFDQAAELLEIQGENQFRVRAYRRAARVIEGLPQSVRSLLSAGRDLSELPGIGKDLAGKIADIVKIGRFALLDTLKKQLPGELGDMAALPGLGPKRAKLLYDKLNVRTLNDLRRALKTGRLRELKGFGPIIAKKLSDALEKPRAEKRFKLSVVEAEAEALVGFLRDGGRIVVAGSYRRRRDTVGDLDVLVTAKDGARSATSWCAMRMLPRSSSTARRARPSSYAPDCRSMCAPCRKRAMALRSSISPDRRHTISRCVGLPSSTTGSSMNTVCLRASVGSLARPNKRFITSSASLLFRRNCARTAARLRSPKAISCRDS